MKKPSDANHSAGVFVLGFAVKNQNGVFFV
jgi:hypothetical protein